MTHLVWHVIGAAPGQLRIAAYAGQGRAQLVARIGHKPAQPGLAALALLQCGLHVSEHLVEGGAELTHFRARVGFGHAVGQVHGAAAQGQPSDLAGRYRDPP